MTRYNMKKVILQSVDGDYLAPISSIAQEAQHATNADNATHSTNADNSTLAQHALTADKATMDSVGGVIADKYELKQLPFINLGTSSTINLVDNTVNYINISKNTTFKLPTVTDNTYLHQIFVQVKANGVYTINVGTSTFFNGKSPDLSKKTEYNLYYEYDRLKAVWVCGSMKKEGAN